MADGLSKHFDLESAKVGIGSLGHVHSIEILPLGPVRIDQHQNPDAQTLARKRSEVAALQLRFEPLANRELEYGLSLGGFDTEAQATEHLAAVTRRGVRTASVVQERAEMRGFRFRLPAADAALKERAEALGSVMAGKSLRSCG